MRFGPYSRTSQQTDPYCWFPCRCTARDGVTAALTRPRRSRVLHGESSETCRSSFPPKLWFAPGPRSRRPDLPANSGVKTCAARLPYQTALGSQAAPYCWSTTSLTTGATADECARVLLRAGAKQVLVATVARAVSLDGVAAATKTRSAQETSSRETVSV